MHRRFSRFLCLFSTWYSSWILLVALVGVGILLPEIQPSLSYARTRSRAKQCRDQMKVLIAAEQEHFLDHRSFTTEQSALSRYKPFAEMARCPICGKPYIIEFTQKEIYVRCPCPESKHGWTHALAPSAEALSTSERPP